MFDSAALALCVALCESFAHVEFYESHFYCTLASCLAVWFASWWELCSTMHPINWPQKNRSLYYGWHLLSCRWDSGRVLRQFWALFESLVVENSKRAVCNQGSNFSTLQHFYSTNMVELVQKMRRSSHQRGTITLFRVLLSHSIKVLKFSRILRISCISYFQCKYYSFSLPPSSKVELCNIQTDSLSDSWHYRWIKFLTVQFQYSRGHLLSNHGFCEVLESKLSGFLTLSSTLASSTSSIQYFTSVLTFRKGSSGQAIMSSCI